MIWNRFQPNTTQTVTASSFAWGSYTDPIQLKMPWTTADNPVDFVALQIFSQAQLNVTEQGDSFLKSLLMIYNPQLRAKVSIITPPPILGRSGIISGS